MRRCITLLATALVALFALTGCNTVSTSSTRYPGSPTFPTSDPAHVQVLHAKPTRSHVPLGEIRPMPFSTTVADKVIDTALRELGAKLGADAVVVIGNRVQGNGPPFVGGWLRARRPMST